MQALRRVSVLLVFLLMVGTLLSHFVLPSIEDERARKKYGLPDARVTDTARTPYLCVNEVGQAAFAPDVCGDLETLVVPEIINGIVVRNFSLSRIAGQPERIRTLVLPRTYDPTVGGQHLMIDSWDSLKTIVVPEGVQDVSMVRLTDNASLKDVYLPRSIERVYKDLLDKQGEGTVLHYAGSEEEWLALGSSAKYIAEHETVVYHSSYQGET